MRRLVFFRGPKGKQSIQSGELMYSVTRCHWLRLQCLRNDVASRLSPVQKLVIARWPEVAVRTSAQLTLGIRAALYRHARDICPQRNESRFAFAGRII